MGHELGRGLHSIRRQISGKALLAVVAWGASFVATRVALEGVTPVGLVSPRMQDGFTPACGWPEFLAKMWLLKHYLDCTARMCQGQSDARRGQ